MLDGTMESLIFQADFEDVDVERGSFAFFSQVSGLTATGGPVEVQNNHPAVGSAANGRQHLELDGINGVQVDLGPLANDLRLVFEYSPRPGVDARLNEVEIYFNNRLLEKISADGTDQNGTRFQTIEIPLESSGSGTNLLEFRSNSPDDRVGVGGLVDNIRVFEILGELALSAIADQELAIDQTLSLRATLLPPADTAEGVVFSLVEAPPGATIDPATGVLNWVASEQNVEAAEAANDRVEVGPAAIVFQASFEELDVPSGEFDFFNELSGFSAAGRGVEVQNNHPSVGAASEGQRLVELDGTNQISRRVPTVFGDQYELRLDYSPRPGVDVASNAIDIFWDGQLLDTISADGTNLEQTDFKEFRFDVSSFSGAQTELILASREAGSRAGFGGLIDNVRLIRRPVTMVDGVSGKYEVTVRATTPDGRSDTESFQICLVDGAIESGPRLAPMADIQVDEAQTLSVFALATDNDLPNDTLTFSIESGPIGLMIDAESGEITWTPSEAQGPGQYRVTLRVTDSSQLFDETSFDVLVGEVGTPPVLEPIVTRNISVEQTLLVQVRAADADLPSETLTFSLTAAPEGMTIETTADRMGLIRWTPSDVQEAGRYEVIVRVEDETGLFDTASFVVNVAASEEELTNGILRGIVFEDANRNGVRDPGEFGRTGRVVYLDANDNQIFDAGELSTVTQFAGTAAASNAATDSETSSDRAPAEAGQYEFTGLAAGNYTVRVVDLNSNEITLPGDTGAYVLSVAANQTIDGLDFGSFFDSGSISGTTFLDSETEGQSGFQVYLDQNDNGQLDNNERFTVTDSDGNYEFVDLPAGDYIVREVQRPGFRQLAPGQLTEIETELFGPTAYLSFADSPFRDLEFSEFVLEDFEDQSLDIPGLTAINNSPGGSALAPSGPAELTDSVDGDDGAIDGDGTGGWEFLPSGNDGGESEGHTYLLNPGELGYVPTHFGLVWTDGSTSASTEFLAYDFNDQLIGQLGPFQLGDGDFFGGTAEDRFFGVAHAEGIGRVVIRTPSGINSLTVDHLQVGRIEPSNNTGYQINLEQGEDRTAVDFVNQSVNRAPVIVSEPVTGVTAITSDVDEFTKIELRPFDVASNSSAVFSTLPTENPSLFGFTGTDVRTVNFDFDFAGNPIASGTVLTDQYSELGVRFTDVPVFDIVFGGPASAPNATFAGGTDFSEIVFTVPVVAAGIINTSPDGDAIEYYSPEGELIFSTTDGGSSINDRFVGARSNRSQLIGSIRYINRSGALELDELVFEVAPETSSYRYDVDAIDPDGDPLVYSLIESPEGMTIDPVTGFIEWEPTASFGRDNLLSNSSFDAGLNGFVTDYGDDPSVAQSVTVTSNPNAVVGAFGDFGDNTTGDGSMLLVNGATIPDQTVWETTIAVDPNTDFIFSAAFASAFAISPAEIRFEINGEQLAVVALESEVGVWDTIQLGWNSSDSTSATLRIVDLNLTEFGNDFALDDIKFEKVITSAPVTVRATDPLGLFDEQRFEITIDDGAFSDPRITSMPRESAVVDFAYEYLVEVTDADRSEITYRLLQAPAGMSISDDGLISWTPGVDDLGEVVVEVQVADESDATDTQQFILVVAATDEMPPTVRVSSSGVVVNPGDLVTFSVVAEDNIAVAEIQLIVDGEIVALDALGRAIVLLNRSGLIEAIATATDAAGNSATTNSFVRVLAPSDLEFPNVEIVSPQMNAEVPYLADVVATIEDENLLEYRVDFALAADVDLVNLAADDADYTLLASGTENVTNEIVATFDPTLLTNDAYVIRVLAVDVNGRIQTRGTIVNVVGDAKLGNFRLDFTDLSIPLAGIPIQINRSYDTLNANEQRDGGFGWDIGLANPNIRETVPDNGGGTFSQAGYKVGTRVFITAPDGRRVGFTFQPEPVGSLIGTTWRPAFVADAGVNLQLDDANNPGNALGQAGDGTFGFGFFGLALGGYNPNQFVLTTEDGTQYFYDQDLGLTGVEDTNGNTITVTDDAITHSGGQSIQFIRDATGRIEQIIDPEGNAIGYQYDANGDMVAFTDQSGETTQFEYSDEFEHYLDRVIDPNGIVTASVQYDDRGRFVGLIDALGNEIKQDFDLDAQTFSQTDANGNQTFVKFDDRGNVTEEIDALGNVTTYEYGDPRNPTRETAITDRNGNTTRFKYDGRGNTVLIEDENGQFTRFQYDALNNVTRIIGPADADPGDGYADTLVDSFFQAGQVTGLTVREDLDDNNGPRILESADIILGPAFDPDSEGPLDSDHIVLDAGDFVTVAFDEVVADRPGDDLFVFTPYFFGNFAQQGRRADVSVSTDGVNFISVGQVGEINDNAIDLADSGITGEVRLVRITALDTGLENQNGYVLTAIQASPADNPSTSFGYDANGNLTSIENVLGETASFTYDGLGRRLTFTDFNGNTTTFDYTDSDGNPDVIRFADGAYQELQYNPFGQTTRESFFESDGTLVEQTESVYDDAGRLLETIDGAGNRVVRTYQGNNLVSETIVNPASPNETIDTPLADRLSRITEFAYDAAGNVLRQIDAEGGVVEFRYDGNGNRILLQDPVGNITTWIYDADDRMIEERDPLFNEGLTIEAAVAALAVASGADFDANVGADHVRVFDYDAEGNQIERIDRNGRRIESTYDQTDRLLEERWFSATGERVDTAVFTYDERGNQVSATDSDSRLLFEYDELNRLTLVSNVGTAGAPTTILEYQYDAQGNVVSVVDNAGVTVDSDYDLRNRLGARLWLDADGSGDVDDARVDYEYNAAGRVSQINRYSDLLATTLVGTTERTYDLAGRSDLLAHLGSTGELIASYDYDYDFAGLLINEDRQHQLSQFTQTAQYAYDRTGQLLSAIYSGQPDEFFAYDANGNRESDSRPGSVYSTETGNRLASDGLFDYEYDGEGNLVLKTKLTTGEDGQAGETTEYVYDHRNRLIEVTITSAGGVILDEVSYGFDAFGRRISRTENGSTVHFVYNGDNVWADFDESGEALARYLFGNRIDENIARIRAGEGTVWYLVDRLGTVRDLIDADGAVVNHSEMKAYGKLLSQTDVNYGDRFVFTGRELDTATNDYYYRARSFNPALGAFNSNDPIGFLGRDFNLYRYVNNSATNEADPTGTVAITEAQLFSLGLNVFRFANAANDIYQLITDPDLDCVEFLTPGIDDVAAPTPDAFPPSFILGLTIACLIRVNLNLSVEAFENLP